MERLICVIIGYIFGLLQTGYIYGKIQHIDIRQHGSGNAGTTNALRTLGWKAGAITFLGDCLKCVAAVGVIYLIYGAQENIQLLAMYGGMGAVIGHNYPFYLRFKGGKGIAATAGLIFSTNPVMMLIAAVIFITIVAVTRYVSLGSLVLVVVFVIEVVVYGQVMHGFSLTQNECFELYAIAVFLMLLAFYKHRANIKRLMAGTENKFGVSNKAK